MNQTTKLILLIATACLSQCIFVQSEDMQLEDLAALGPIDETDICEELANAGKCVNNDEVSYTPYCFAFLLTFIALATT